MNGARSASASAATARPTSRPSTHEVLAAGHRLHGDQRGEQGGRHEVDDPGDPRLLDPGRRHRQAGQLEQVAAQRADEDRRPQRRAGQRISSDAVGRRVRAAARPARRPRPPRSPGPRPGRTASAPARRRRRRGPPGAGPPPRGSSSAAAARAGRGRRRGRRRRGPPGPSRRAPAAPERADRGHRVPDQVDRRAGHQEGQPCRARRFGAARAIAVVSSMTQCAVPSRRSTPRGCSSGTSRTP